MKKILLLCTTGFSILGYAQNDSAGKLAFSGFQIEIQGPVTFREHTFSKEQLMALNTGDPLINQSFDGYQNIYYYHQGTTVNFTGAFAARAYFSVKTKKIPYLDFYAGLSSGSANIGSLSFFRQITDTMDIFSNQLGQNIYKTRRITHYNYFGVNSRKTLFLLGLNAGTNKQRWVWLTAGVELAPGLLHHYNYHSHSFYSEDHFLVPEGTNTPIFSHMSIYSTGNTASQINKNIPAAGFYLQGSIPLSINIRLAKKIPILKNLHATFQAAPGFIFAKDNVYGTRSQGAIFTLAGIRYLR